MIETTKRADALRLLFALLAALGARRVSGFVPATKANELIDRLDRRFSLVNRSANELADQINGFAYLGSRRIFVNGRQVATSALVRGDVAKSWRTGTVSVKVRTKSGNSTTDMWVKPSQIVDVEIR